MPRIARRALALLLLGGGLALLHGCAEGDQSLAPVRPADEIPPGPGLFTGEDGAFIIKRD